MKRFKIDHIDPLGQGVYKDEESIYFIPKTLPEETGTFSVIRSKKGVHFGQLDQIDQASPDRITPECQHFTSCSGCHYQHTNREIENELKLKNYQRLLDSINIDLPIRILNSSDRTGYRNRVQIHYDIKQNKFGFIKSHSRDITPIENCILATQKIQKEIKKLTTNNLWIEFAKKENKNRGHVEIYEFENKISIAWNQSYAHKGFSQVNMDVNKLVQKEVAKICSGQGNVLDLFGGNGNLVKELNAHMKVTVDTFTNAKDGIVFNLFQDNALEKFKRLNTLQFNTLILDPPRSGFKDLYQWVQHYQPQKLLYISCNPSTMIRDLKHLPENYAPELVYMIDFFPSTYHYEAAILLNRRAI